MIDFRVAVLPPPPVPPGLTRFELLQICSDWLAGMLNRFVSSSTLRPCKDTGVRPLLTVNSLLFSSSSFSSSSSFCRADPLRSFADQLQLTLWYAESIWLVVYIIAVQGRWGTSIIGSPFAALLLPLCLPLQVWPVSNFCRSTLIDSLVGSINSARRVHRAAARTLRYVHDWLSIRCSSCYSYSSSCTSRSDPFRTFADQLWLTRWYAQSIRLVEYSKTRQGRCSTYIIGSWFAALHLHLLLLLLPGWPSSIVCRSTPIDSTECAIDLAGRVHQDGSTTLGYVQYWLSIRYSTPSHTPSPPPAPRHHRHSAWQRTERRRVYGDTGMMEMDYATG